MVKQQCHICNKWFDRLVTHWRMSSACKDALQARDLKTNLETISQQHESVDDIQNSVRDLSSEQMNCKPCYNAHTTSVIESRLCDLFLEGIEELDCTVSKNEDNGFEDFISNRNMAVNEHDDNYTIQSEDSFFPLPPIAIIGMEAVAHVGHGTNTMTQDERSSTILAKQHEPIYAPVSSFEFHRTFSNEEFFMIKLCQICDKANVPHHIVDDIVDLLRECKQNNVKVQPELLRKRVHFIKHLEHRFKSPIPQSVVIGLEGFSSNDLEYSRDFRDCAEIIWYDFKEQALDLIHDINIWGDMNNFKGTVDPKNPFSGLSPRTDGLLDEVVDGAWYKRTFEECKTIAGNEEFLVLGVILYCDKTGTDVYQRAGLEPLSFTFTIFNRECRYRSHSWRVLGYVPDLELKSSAYKSKLRLGLVGKGRPCCNYHACLSRIVHSLKQKQGNKEPIREWIHIGDYVAFRRLFSQLLL